MAFYQRFGRPRDYSLDAFISALILQIICSIPTDTLLIIFLNSCKELRDFCGFSKVPDASKFTRFKQDFTFELTCLFNNLVDITEPICRAIDSTLASTLTYDTSAIEAFVTENNPKYINSLILKLKAAYKNNSEVDPYKMAYGLMPSCSSADPSIKQMHINGHFCYVHKFGIVTNGLGIVRHITFLDDNFKLKHPEVIIEKKSDSPDEDKSIGDSTSLQPVLLTFLILTLILIMMFFLGDSAFDKGNHYTFLKDICKFKNVLIPLNYRNKSNLKVVGFNGNGYPLCPNDDTLVMKYSGITKEKGRTSRIKWICPKFKKGIFTCDNPCSTAKYGRTTYTFNNQDFRLLPDVVRDSDEWVSTYKKHCVVERTINHLKTNMCVADRKSRNLKTRKLICCLPRLLSFLLLFLPTSFIPSFD